MCDNPIPDLTGSFFLVRRDTDLPYFFSVPRSELEIYLLPVFSTKEKLSVFFGGPNWLQCKCMLIADGKYLDKLPEVVVVLRDPAITLRGSVHFLSIGGII